MPRASRSPLAFAVVGFAFAVTFAAALLQSAKPFYFDSGNYWLLGDTFTLNGHFSLLNFEDEARGYALPLIYHALKVLSEGLAWSPSSLVKLFNALIFVLIGAVLAPRLAEITYPQGRWGPARRLTFVALLLVFWAGYLNFPLSDFPALAMVLLALVAITQPDRPAWMLSAGLAGGLALDMRASYLPLLPILLVLVVWRWLDRANAPHASIARRTCCVGLLLLGFAVVSVPQSLASHRHGFTWSFVPGATVPTSELYLPPGLAYQRYDTYVGTGEAGPRMNYGDETGARLLAQQKKGEITSSSQYLGLILSHPLTMAGVFTRHIIDGLDARYNTVYVEHVETGSIHALRIAGFLLVFLALVRVLWPAARRHLGQANWRYPVALLLCCSTSVPTRVETRYMLPAYICAYIIALAPGWPSLIEQDKAGVRRFRTTAVLLASGVIFTAIVWRVVESASSHLQFS